MRKLNRWTCVVLLALCVGRISQVGACDMPRAKLAPRVLDDLVARAIGDDSDTRQNAIAQLRAAGPDGLKALMDANADAIRSHRASAGSASATNDARWLRISAAIDAVAAQKDAWASGLYWYTDLEAAKKAARETGRPIVSLRLLGRLDSEFSCANSRFFRTVLYANAEVSKVLSERFILHWQSVRPVPKVTLDFGDGRVVERTITGNSIHYVLAADERVIDGIPGLYGPKAFLRQLDDAAQHARAGSNAAGVAELQQWHALRATKALAEWDADLQAIGASRATSSDAVNDRPIARADRAHAAPPPAIAAAPLAVGKGKVELRMVAAITPDLRSLESATADNVWEKLAALHAEDAKLDGGSRALLASKHPDALEAGRLTTAKAIVENPLVKIIRNFERSIAEDTVRNEYTFHRQIHEWLARGALPDGKPASDVALLNERVYADLFLTPSSDPWLGLVPTGTYSALPDEGICKLK